MKPNQTKYINNRKARFNYFIDETFKAGMVLKGSEVKSIKAGHANISEAYCYFNNGELFLKNANFPSIQNNSMFGHDDICDRKLLLKKKELSYIQKKIALKGFTIVPLSIEIPVYGYIKCNIGICRGKHNYDKRETIKERDYQRSLKTF